MPSVSSRRAPQDPARDHGQGPPERQARSSPLRRIFSGASLPAPRPSGVPWKLEEFRRSADPHGPELRRATKGSAPRVLREVVASDHEVVQNRTHPVRRGRGEGALGFQPLFTQSRRASRIASATFAAPGTTSAAWLPRIASTAQRAASSASSGPSQVVDSAQAKLDSSA